jgi:hypothetical protein
VVLKDCPGRGILVHVSEDSAGALDNLACFAFVIKFAKSAPLAEVHLGWNADKGDFVLVADSFDQLGVGFFVTVFSKATQLSTAGVKSTHSLVKSAAKTINLDSVLDDNLQSVHRVGDFLNNLNDLSDLSRGFNFHVLEIRVMEGVNIIRNNVWQAEGENRVYVIKFGRQR